MKCPNCKQEIDDNSVFCDYCGEKIVQKTPERPVVEKKEPNENVPKKKRKWLKPTLIGGGIVLAIGIVIGVLAITDTSRWDEINSNQIASWPSCHGGDGTFYILQKGEDQSLVRVEGEFPISIVREIDFCGYHRDIFAQEGDNNGVGVFAILKLGSIEFSIFKYLDDGKISRYDITTNWLICGRTATTRRPRSTGITSMPLTTRTMPMIRPLRLVTSLSVVIMTSRRLPLLSTTRTRSLNT